MSENFKFEAEVSRLLEIVTHSLYSEREIFLRELISNSADACDRLRYLSLTDSSLKKSAEDFKISILSNQKDKTLLITDNGIGMNQEDLKENLGTIARSGTGQFIKQLQEKKENSANLIGQFGVGFYASFMVATKVEVLTRKAGEEKAYKWTSTGAGSYTIEEAKKETHGTEITLYLKKDAEEFLEKSRLEHIIKTYSDFITIPIFLGIDADKSEQVNAAKPLWTIPKKDITAKDYEAFYHSTCQAFDTPWQTIHFTAEGILNYTGLLFIPSQRPFDLFDPKREVSLKLYIRHVFITDKCSELLPKYFRFIKGIVDAEDLSVNVSREILQNDPRLRKMRQGLVKKITSTLQKQLKDNRDDYLKFWQNFGAVLKEGLYEEPSEKDTLLDLSLFYSAKTNKHITLAEYIESFAKEQKDVFYLSGSDLATLKNNPNLEGFLERGLDVLLLTDPVDEFWSTMVSEYKDHKLISITSSEVDLSKFDEKKESKESDKKVEIEPLIKFIKSTLGDAVKNVRESKRLRSSPVSLVEDDGGMSARLQQMMQQDQKINPVQQQTLEVNPDHVLIQKLLKDVGNKDAQQRLQDECWLLLDQAMIANGIPVNDGQAFAQRLNRLMTGQS
jgi:molecular chaperone HtpG